LTDLINIYAEPQAVKDFFQASKYATWRIDDADMIEKNGTETIYIIEVESGNRDMKLHHNGEGIRVNYP